MVFDPALLSNPRVTADLGSLGYTALGNETSPGHFRFVLFKNPANAPVDGGRAVLGIYFSAADVQGSRLTTVTFTMPAAARIVPGPPTTVLSVQPTVFEPFQVIINGNATRNWSLYE
jgi:hypothetical protein